MRHVNTPFMEDVAIQGQPSTVGCLGVPAIGSGIVNRISDLFDGLRTRWNMLMVTLGN